MMNGQPNVFSMNSFEGSIDNLDQGYNPNFLQPHGVMQEHGLAFPGGFNAAMIASKTENVGLDGGQHMFQINGMGRSGMNDNDADFDAMVAPGENILQFGDIGMDGGMNENATIAGSDAMAGDDGIASASNDYGAAEEDMVQFISANVFDNEAYAHDGTPEVKDEDENADAQMS